MCELWFKRSRGKTQHEETEKQQYVIVTENNFFKSIITENVKIMTRSSIASLTVLSHGIPHVVKDSWLSSAPSTIAVKLPELRLV